MSDVFGKSYNKSIEAKKTRMDGKFKESPKTTIKRKKADPNGFSVDVLKTLVDLGHPKKMEKKFSKGKIDVGMGGGIMGY